jgi:hypothetical protein
LGFGVISTIITPSTFIKLENTKFIDSDSLKSPNDHHITGPDNKQWKINFENQASAYTSLKIF